ncbi:type II toxin-antitoxin system HicB family antitoxin [Candidatus Peregrinibacteria bacterium]|nr:type II toxin-antitoxin system HicB family antitoxin [Candidatus Peregrinibacteria bacterium]
MPYFSFIDKMWLFKILIIKPSKFTVYIEQDEDGMFIGSIPAVPSCHAEGKTQALMLKNLSEVLELCLRNVNKKEILKTKFIGIQNLELSNA